MTTTPMKTQNELPDVLAVARGLLGVLGLDAVGQPTWQLDDTTLRRLKDEDPDVHRFAGLRQPSTGATVSVSRDNTRLYFTADYPSGYEPFLDGRGRVYRESITVAASKTVEQVAREMTRRLFADTDYFAHLKTALDAKTDAEAGQARSEATAETLRRMLGVPAEKSWRADASTPDQLRRLKTPFDSDQFSVEGTVSNYEGGRVDLTVEGLRPKEAEAVVTLLASLRGARAAAKVSEEAGL